MKRSESEVREAAYRARAGVIGIMTSCICTYPVEQEATSTGHSEFCPSHLMITARAARADATLANVRAFVDLFAGFDVMDIVELSTTECLVIESLADALARKDVDDVCDLMDCLPECPHCPGQRAIQCSLLERHAGGDQ